jgi:hypothetical protein
VAVEDVGLTIEIALDQLPDRKAGGLGRSHGNGVERLSTLICQPPLNQ